MWKIAFCAVLALPSGTCKAHQDTPLPIGPDGALRGLPAPWGPAKVSVSYSAPGVISGVEVRSPNFHVRLNQCVVSHLPRVVAVHAAGSWYHRFNEMPPYVSLYFVERLPESRDGPWQAASVVLSLRNGQILAGDRTWRTWWGSFRSRVARPAEKCSGWSAMP